MENILSKKESQKILKVLVFGGLVLRIVKYLIFNSVSHDEAIAYTYFKNTDYGEILSKNTNALDASTNPSGYYIFIKWWESLSSSELWLFAPMFIASICSLVLLYKVCKINIEKYEKHRVDVLVVAGIISLSSFYVHFGIMLLTYSFAICLTLLLIYINALKSIGKIQEKKANILMVFGFIIYALIDYSFIWPLGFFILINILDRQKRNPKFIISLLLIPLVDTHWLMKTVSSALKIKTIINTTDLNTVETILMNLSGFLGYSFLHNKTIFIISTALVIILFVMMIKFKGKISLPYKLGFFLLFLLVSFSLIAFPIFDYKNAFFLLTIAIAFGASRICDIFGKNKYTIVIMTLIFIISLFNFKKYNHLHYSKILEKNSYQDILKRLVEKHDGHVTIVHNDREMEPLKYYNEKKFGNKFDIFPFFKEKLLKKPRPIYFLFLINDPRKEDKRLYEQAVSKLGCKGIEKLKLEGFYKFEKCL